MGGKVILIKEALVDSPEKCLTSCRLRHPKTNEESLFFLSSKSQQVLELIKYETLYQTWMINDRMMKDGSFLMATIVNPLYLLLPYIKKKPLHFMNLDSLLEDEEFPDLKRLKGYLSCIETFTDTKVIEGSVFYRYNESKTIQWLKDKVFHVAKLLEKTEILKSSQPMISDCDQNRNESPTDQSKEYACDMISEYLSGEFSLLLRDKLNLSLPTAQDKDTDGPPAKKPKLDDPIPLEDYSKHNLVLFPKNEKLTPAQRKLKKIDTSGMKAISAFFTQGSKL